MSIFDDPFDADSRVNAGCICGQHRSPAEHEHALRALRCEPVVESAEKRYENVVASAVLRAGEERELAFAALVEDLAVVSTALGSG